MIESKYVGNFSSRLDVARKFDQGGPRRADNFAPREGFPTDDQILYAEYETPSYEGYAYVLYEQDGKLFEVHGSHCSCYGLEGQWQPEETSWAAIANYRPGNSGAPEAVIAEAKRRLESVVGG